MDANQNGSIEPEEISDRARGFLVPRLREAGIDTSKPIPISKITEAFQKMREDRDRESNRAREAEYKEQEKASSGIMADFSGDEEIPLVPDFSLPDDSPLLRSGPLEDRYSKKVIDRLNQTLRERDHNRSGVLEAEELRRGRWSPSPYVSDLNKDGRLTKVELAERYTKMYAAEESDKGSDRSSGRDRWRRKGEERSESESTAARDSQRSSKRTTSATKASSASAATSKQDRITKYADSMMVKYDKNKNGSLEEDEWKEMRGSPQKGDADKNGNITRDELIVFFGGTPGSATSSQKRSASTAATSRIHGNGTAPTFDQRLKEMGVSGKFISQDANKDGNLQMSEYSRSWDETMLEKFDNLDSNHDGVISPSEWINNGGK